MRRLLLDSHVLLWWLADAPALREEAHRLIADRSNHVVVSAVSVWEFGIKAARGKLAMPDGLEQAVQESGFVRLPITFAHARRAGELPRHHDDPFDRMLVAQAQIERLEIITRDRRLRAYEVPLVAA